MTESFLLAHLSDPHLGPMPPARITDLIGKRALGYINWKRNRHMVHRREVLAALVDDLHTYKPNHIALTGDLVNIALSAEFRQAADWLSTIGSPHDVSLVPGNHDAYAGRRNRFADVWAGYMLGDGNNNGAVTFPYLRRRGPLALIGLSTAVPSAPFMATGRVGHQQLAALDRLLAQLKDEDVCRVLMIHHPPQSARGRWTARLTDAPAVLDVLKHHGVELVLHGHDHRHALVWLEGANGRRIPSLGITSASASSGGHHQPAAYQLLTITREQNEWRIARRVRGFANEHSRDSIVDLKSEAV